MTEARYLTDDRDFREEDLRELVIAFGGNGDWYVSVAQPGRHSARGVRICTSGGASSQCPGLTEAISRAFKAMQAAQQGVKFNQPAYSELEREVAAWRAKAHRYEYDDRSGEIVLKDDPESRG